MAEPENTPTNALATASCAVQPNIEPTSAAPTADLHPREPAEVAPLGRGTDTSVPATNETAVDPSPHLPQIPGYQIIRAIGGGGMGTVFKAIHLGLNRVVALKLINAGWATDTDFRARFDREARTLAAIEHPNIVPVFDAGSWQGLPYLTMKFIAGKTLYHRLEALRRAPRAAAQVLAQVARAVHYLHSHGIIHRDLKPLNILLTTDGMPLVADFGLARPLSDDSDLSVTLVPLGTRQYMSPEQSRGGRENYTPACDIWALGVILYELLAGHRPFGHEDPLELVRQIRFDPMPSIPADRNAPPELEAIARKCLEKAPGDRYPTAEALAADLDRWGAGEPVSAPLPGPTAAPPKNARRSRILLGAGALAVVVALVAAAAVAFRTPAAPEPPVDQPLPVVPAPTAMRTTLERFATGEPVELTDTKGKPIGATTGFPGHDIGVRTQDGYYEYFTTGIGLVELSGEPFPLPLRVKADVALTQLTAPDSMVGVYVARRDWLGGPVTHRSLVWFGFRDDLPAPPKASHRVCMEGLYWWERHFWNGTTDWDAKKTPWKRPDGKPAFTRVEIDVRADAITGRVNGVALKPITTATVAAELRQKVGERPRVGPYEFTPPLFGPGIGIFLSNANGIVAELTVSKLTL